VGEILGLKFVEARVVDVDLLDGAEEGHTVEIGRILHRELYARSKCETERRIDDARKKESVAVLTTEGYALLAAQNSSGPTHYETDASFSLRGGVSTDHAFRGRRVYSLGVGDLAYGINGNL